MSTIFFDFPITLCVVLCFWLWRKDVCEGFCRKEASVPMSYVKWLYISAYSRGVSKASSLNSCCSSPNFLIHALIAVFVAIYNCAWESAYLTSSSFPHLAFCLLCLILLIPCISKDRKPSEEAAEFSVCFGRDQNPTWLLLTWKQLEVTENYLFCFQQIKALNNPCFLNEHLKSQGDPRAAQKSYQTEQTWRKFFLLERVFLSWKLALVFLIHAYLMFTNSSEDIGTVFLLEKQWNIYVSVGSS